MLQSNKGSCLLVYLYHVHDGAEQLERDRLMRLNPTLPGDPLVWRDPELGPWLLGYDHIKDVEDHWPRPGGKGQPCLAAACPPADPPAVVRHRPVDCEYRVRSICSRSPHLPTDTTERGMPTDSEGRTNVHEK